MSPAFRRPTNRYKCPQLRLGSRPALSASLAQSCAPTLAGVTILRMDNVGIVFDDLDAAIAFFVELGLELEGRMTVEGEWSDRARGRCAGGGAPPYTARSFGMVSADSSSKTPKSRDSTFSRFWSALIASKISPLM
jgi:hypothetical protein